jgi:ubiquinone/menaquinone biosynthesis C-methylase UbiE
MRSQNENDTEPAVAVHDAQAALFHDRYRQLERDPYWDAFTYTRKKITEVSAPYLDALPDGSRLLDVGCGTGEQLALLAERFVCAGCDPSEAMLSYARRRNPEIPFRRAAADALPYDDDEFDVVLSIEVFRYLERPGPALAELRRVLRPGGLCLLTFAPARTTTLYPLLNRVSSRVGLFGLTRLRQYFHTAADVERLLADASFVDVEVHARFFGPFIYANRLSRRLASALLRRWEPIDDRIGARPGVRDLANLFVVAARIPTR